MMPTLKVYETNESVVSPLKNEETKEDEPIFFEISSSADQIAPSTIDFDRLAFVDNKAEHISETPASNEPAKFNDNTDSNSDSTLVSGGYLAKPSQIYVEEKPLDSASIENSKPLQQSVHEDDSVIEMQLVVKDSQPAAEEPVVQQTQPIMNASVEEPALQDETEDLRRRAMDRIAKLRNLSFNVNGSDPNSEFETVPAYLRRNMDMTNQIADVESFYSAYTVKSNENNQAEIGHINSFLDGKKPD